MAIQTMLLERKVSAEARLDAGSVIPRGDPEPRSNKGTEKKTSPTLTHNLCHQLATFFKIGRGYDWEEQYREYSEYWENYFQARSLEQRGPCQRAERVDVLA